MFAGSLRTPFCMLDNCIKTSIIFCMELFSKQEITEGVYRDYQYLIADNGSHFCAYVYLPKGHPFYKFNFYEEEHSLPVHGGVTYYDRNSKYSVIGWDYLHYFDIETEITLEMVLKDCQDVIDSLINLVSEQALNDQQTPLDKVFNMFRK